MPKEITVTLKNIVIKGNADDGKGKFNFESTGDVRITADPTTVMAIAKYFEEVTDDAA